MYMYVKQNGPFKFSYKSAHYNVTCFFLSFPSSYQTWQDYRLILIPQNQRLIPPLPVVVPVSILLQCFRPRANRLSCLALWRTGPRVSLRILKILQTESSVEYRSKSCYMYIVCSHFYALIYMCYMRVHTIKYYM